MKNKTIAIIGVLSYILSVLSSAKNLEGVSIAPSFLIALYVLVLLTFLFLATIRLWYIARHISIMLIISAISLFFLTSIQAFALSVHGGLIIILLNLVKVFYFVTIVWAILKLFKKENK